MSLALLFPLGLLALAAWALPMLLHLARREQRTPTPFAALRWLAVRQKPRQRLRLEEVLLLAVRLALLAALALLLARPAVTGGDADQRWEATHPALAAPAGPAADGVQRRWLAPGFPPLDQPRPTADAPTSSLLRQLDAELPAGAILAVRVPTEFDGADGERPRLSRPVDWRVETSAAPAVPEVLASRRRLVIRHDAAHAAPERWLHATAVAWQTTVDPVPVDSATTDSPLPPGEDIVLAWLAEGPLPAAVRQWIEAGGAALLAMETTWPLAADGTPVGAGADEPLAVAAALGRGRIVQLRRTLQPAAWPALLEADFPRTLRELLAAPAPAPTRARAAVHAPLEGGPGFEAAPRELFDVLLWLVLALFALERFLATGRRPETAA